MNTLKTSLAVSLVFTLFLSGCIATSCPNCGRLMTNLQVDMQFESLQILPDHHYYYNGEIVEPDTVVAIHKDYTLEEGFWTKINLTHKQLKEWMWMFSTVEGVWDEDDRITIDYQGSIILNPQGRKVGFYYSKYTNTFIRFPSPGTITIDPPQPPLDSQVLQMRELD